MDPASSMQMLSTTTSALNTSSDGIMVTALVILVMLSAFFSGTETAYTSVNKTRMKTLAGDGNKKAKSVLKIIDNYDKFISTILVGNNIVNILATTISTLLFTSFMNGNSSLGATVSTIVMTLVILIFGEITPKILVRTFPKAIQWQQQVPFVS